MFDPANDRIDAVADSFEKACRSGLPPSVNTYLEQVPETDRPALLRELVRLDLEYHYRAGEANAVEACLARHPGLAANSAEVLDLIALEFRLGFVAGRPLAVAEYQKRFPHLSAEIAAQLSQESVETSAAAVRTHDFYWPGGAKPTAPLPKCIARFEVLELLGQGNFGQVFRARDPLLDREVAIKTPLLDAVPPGEERVRFFREARTAARLHHPNICPVYEVGQMTGDVPYIVMALVRGTSLAEELKNRSEPLSPEQAALMVRKLALALDVAHARGIVHRDLKPANIMIEHERQDVVIMDFGLARHVRPGDIRQTREGTVMGTPAYMSPEQARGDVRAVGSHSDIYSLGVILYEVLAGGLPFVGTVNEVIGQVLHIEPLAPSKYRAGIDPALEAICLKAMAKAPGKRYAAMSDMAAALSHWLHGTLRKKSDGEVPSATEADTVAQMKDTLVEEIVGPIWRTRKFVRRLALGVIPPVLCFVLWQLVVLALPEAEPLDGKPMANLALPKVEPVPMAPPPQPAPNPPDVVKRPVESAPVPPAELLSTKIVELGTYERSNVADPLILLLQMNAKDKQWYRIEKGAEPARVWSGSPLIGLPGYRAFVKLNSGVLLTLHGNVVDFFRKPQLYESLVTLHHTDQFDLDLTLHRGRIYLENAAEDGKPRRVRVRFDNPTNPQLGGRWDVTLEKTKAEVVIERWAVFPPGLPLSFKNSSPTAMLALVALTEDVWLKNGASEFRLTPPPGPALMLWKSTDAPEGASPQVLKQIPDFLLAKAPWPKDLDPNLRAHLEKTRLEMGQAVASLNNDLARTRVDVALHAALASPDSSKRRLAIHCLAALDDLPVLVRCLDDKERQDVRLSAFESLRYWRACDRDHDGQLFKQLRIYSPIEADIIMTLLCDYAPEDRSNPITYQTLIDYLSNARLPIREMAHWNLIHLVPAGRNIQYSPIAPPAERRRGEAEWRKLIPIGKLPPADGGK